MRKLMWFTIGFGTASGLCVYLFGAAGLHQWTVFTLAAALCTYFLGRNYAPARKAAMVLLGCSGALVWYQLYYANYLRPAAALEGVTQRAVVTATDYSFETGYGWGVDGSIQIEGRSYQVRVYLEAEEAVAPGTQMEGTFQFRLTTPDSQEGGTSHSGKGIFLLAYQQEELALSQGDDRSLRAEASRLRRQIQNVLQECIPEDAAPFAKALLLGDATDLTYEVDTHLKVSGIRHVAAVSGLHVSILFALMSTVTFRKRFLTALAGLPMLAVFAAVAGFTPSVTRACVMSALMLLALILNREYDGATALSFAVLVMLLYNPLTITSVSFQLSVASVAGIFLFSASIGRWLSGRMGEMTGKGLPVRLKRWFVSSTATSLSAMSLTVPLSAWYFGTVSLIGVVTNLLTLWVISFVFYGLMGVCLLSFLSQSAALLLGQVTAWLIRYILFTAKAMAAFPLACVYTVSEYITLWLVFVYVLLAVFLWRSPKRPGRLICCACAGLCLALLCSWAEPVLYDTVITVLDVGQGQCILLQSDGKSYLVDCGGDNDASAADIAAETLLSRGITKLDGLILSHLDRDHAGAAENLLSRVEAELVILPPVSNALDLKGSRTLHADRNLQISWGSSKLRVYGEKMLESNNENSLCILLDTEKCDILITGDRNGEGEERLLRAEKLPDVDVLVAGHHGSAFASSELLLRTVRPETVCISAGADNIYGHPAAKTLERLQRFGCNIYRTDVHGTITIRR